MPRQRRVTAGDLLKPVAWRIYDPVATEATAAANGGQRIAQFDDGGQHWAEIEPMRGAALVNATAIKPVRWSVVTMYPVGPVKPLDQLVYNGRTFTVEDVLDDHETGALLTIHVTEEPLNPTPTPS